VGLIVGLDDIEKRINPFPGREQNLDSTALWPVDWSPY
jgi:hypothetical protein